jgi:hypothetical protein
MCINVPFSDYISLDYDTPGDFNLAEMKSTAHLHNCAFLVRLCAIGVKPAINHVQIAQFHALYFALRYKPAGRGFNSRWCHWNFSVT